MRGESRARPADAEGALRLSEEMFTKVFRFSPDWIVISTLEDGRFIDVNDAFLRITGYAREEVIGRTAIELGIWVDPGERAAMVEVLRREGVIRDHEARFRMKSGEIRVMLRSAEVIHLGEERCIISVTRDITERKEAEEKLRTLAEELERRNRELEQFAYVVSHDLRAPLVTVASYLRLLMRRIRGRLDPEAERFIADALDVTSRMGSLIGNLLEYALVDRELHLEPTESGEVLKQTLANLRALVEESGAVVTHDTLPLVTADRTQLTQLLQNLIGNAIKFRGEESPRVHISAVRRGRGWLFSVRDNGVGIPPGDEGRIFDIFQRVHDERNPGSGIGLAICRKIVERHGGRIWAESEQGRGTTFFFTLPAA